MTRPLSHTPPLTHTRTQKHDTRSQSTRWFRREPPKNDVLSFFKSFNGNTYGNPCAPTPMDVHSHTYSSKFVCCIKSDMFIYSIYIYIWYLQCIYAQIIQIYKNARLAAHLSRQWVNSQPGSGIKDWKNGELPLSETNLHEDNKHPWSQTKMVPFSHQRSLLDAFILSMTHCFKDSSWIW